MKFILQVETLLLDVNLGLTKEERENKQRIRIAYSIYSDSINKACLSDDIVDTICYVEMGQKIKNYLELREFKLIEFLTYKIYQLIKEDISATYHIHLEILKVNPIVNDLGLPSFIISDD